MKIYKIVFLVGIIAMTLSCKNNNNNTSKSKQTLNYANSYNWVSLPTSIEKNVDVFYVYPTIYSGTNPQNMDISDLSLRENAQRLLVAQAWVYSAHANLFAPFYRQQSGALQDMHAGNDGKDAYRRSYV